MSSPTDTGREQTGDHPYPDDWEEVSHTAAAYFPHRLTPLTSAGAESVTLENIGIGPVRIARIDWGADVSVHSEHPGAYAVNIPLSGRLESRTGRHEISSAPGTATICPPDVLTDFPHWGASCAILGVRFDRAHLEHEMSRALGRPGARLPMQVDLCTPVGASWLRFVRSLSEQMRDPTSVVRNDLVSAQLLSAATTGFVLAAVPEDVPATAEAPTNRQAGHRRDPRRPGTRLDRAGNGGTSRSRRPTNPGRLPPVRGPEPDRIPRRRSTRKSPPRPRRGRTGRHGPLDRAAMGVRAHRPIRGHLPRPIRHRPLRCAPKRLILLSPNALRRKELPCSSQSA